LSFAEYQNADDDEEELQQRARSRVAVRNGMTKRRAERALEQIARSDDVAELHAAVAGYRTTNRITFRDGGADPRRTPAKKQAKQEILKGYNSFVEGKSTFAAVPEIWPTDDRSRGVAASSFSADDPRRSRGVPATPAPLRRALNSVVHNCDACGKPTKGLACTGCKKTYYCDRDCQKAHWPIHRAVCKKAKRRGAG